MPEPNACMKSARTLLSFAVLLLVLTLPLPAAPADEAAVRQQVLAGIDAMYSMRFDDARTVFNKVIQQQPDNPTGYFFRATIHMWKYLFDRSEPDLGAFLTESDRTIEIAEEALDGNPDDSRARTYIGAMYGYRAMVNIQAENYLKASWDARNCYTHLSETLRRNPREYEAYLGMGIFNFVIGALPETSQLVMNIAGMTGDKDRGLQQLQLAAERAVYAGNDAKLVLGLLNVYYKGDYGAGIGYLKDLLQKYPTNIPILYAMGNIEAQLKKMNNAIGYYKKVIDLSNNSFRQFTIYSNFRLGEAYFRLNDFENSKRAMQKFIKANTEQPFKAIGLLRLAETYEILGDRKFAVQLYARTRQCTPVTTEDKYAVRKAGLYEKAPMSETEIQLVRGVNHVESLQFEKGEVMLRSLLMSPQATGEQKAEAWYHIGEAMRQQNRHAEALEAYRNVIAINPVEERWLMPWSYFRMSQVYFVQKDTKKSRTALDRAKVFSDYDFKEWLVFQIERDLSTLY